MTNSTIAKLEAQLEEARQKQAGKIQGRYEKAVEKLDKANAEHARVKDEQDRIDAWGERVAQKVDAAQAEIDAIQADADSLDVEINFDFQSEQPKVIQPTLDEATAEAPKSKSK